MVWKSVVFIEPLWVSISTVRGSARCARRGGRAKYLGKHYEKYVDEGSKFLTNIYTCFSDHEPEGEQP